MFKNIILMSLILMLFTTSSTNTVASQLSETERGKYKQVIAVHGLQIIEEIPDGITPIEVSSPEELDALLQRIKDDLRNSISTVSEATEDKPREEPDILNVNYIDVNRNCSVALGGITNPHFNTYGRIRVGVAQSSWRWIESANARVGLSGITSGVNLSDTWTQVDISSNNASVDISGGGTLNYYILIPEYFVVASHPISCSLNYSVY